MKKKSLLGVIGSGLLVGATILLMIKSVKRNSTNKCNDKLSNKNDSTDISHEHMTEDTVVDLDVTKKHSSNSIYDRHKTAAQLVKESMEKINDNSDSSSKHEGEFDSMLEELNILSERGKE